MLEGRRLVEPQREAHRVELPLVLERRDHHPRERQQHSQEERGEPGIDEQLPDERVPRKTDQGESTPKSLPTP